MCLRSGCISRCLAAAVYSLFNFVSLAGRTVNKLLFPRLPRELVGRGVLGSHLEGVVRRHVGFGPAGKNLKTELRDGKSH